MKGIEYRAFPRFVRAPLPGPVGAAVQTPVRPQAVVLVGGGIGKLDAVFGSLNTENGGERYQDVTGNLALSDRTDVNG
jgi:hypothetical protein